jgi:hypothetical protein
VRTPGIRSGAGNFAYCVKVLQVRAPIDIDHYPATGVMRRWHNRYGLPGDIDIKFQAASINGREMRLDEGAAFMADVQVYAINTEAFHFMVNRACDDITWGELRAFIETGHKPISVRQQ